MKILILGNGFDIAHGLPTRYSDFLEFAQRASHIYTFPKDANVREYEALQINDWPCSKLAEDAIAQFKEKLKAFFESRKITSETTNENIGNDNDLLARRNVVNAVKVNDRLDKFYDCIKNNVWYKYILELHRTNKTRGKNWIDFESEISLVIQAIDETHTSLDQTFFELKKFLRRENREASETSETNIETNEELKTKLATFSSIYTPVFKEDKGTVGDLRSRLYSDLENLIFALEIYLTDFVETINTLTLPLIESIRPDYVISFNYTKTYERLYLNDVHSYKICHIHGVCRAPQAQDENTKVDENNKNANNMVLGIDEYLPEHQQKQKTDFAIFKKFVQRIRNHNNTAYVSWYEQIEQNVKLEHRGNSDVYIFGHSLDVTDKDILKRFIDSPYTRVHVYAHSKGTEGELISHLLRYVDEETVIRKASMNPPMLEFKVLSQRAAT